LHKIQLWIASGRIELRIMRIRSHLGALLLGALCLMATTKSLPAQEADTPILQHITDVDELDALVPSSALPPEDVMLEIGQQIDTTDLDCSHFVQWLFQQAGLYYGYAPSRVLYKGMSGFKRVSRPHRGDLIVWPGHVGIVVDPDEQTFLSALRSGVKTASYTSRYWKRRGRARFFRYLGLADAPANKHQVAYYKNSGRSAPGSD
jgi:hypothetical protein